MSYATVRAIIFVAFLAFVAIAVVIPFALRLAGVRLIDGGGEDITSSRTEEGKGLLRSIDSGKTWSNAAISEEPRTGFPAEIFDVAAHPTNPDVLFLGTRGQGLWRSETAGASWKKVSDSTDTLQNRSDVYRIALSPIRPDTLYVAAFQDGRGRVLRSDDSGRTFRQLYEVSQNRFGVFDLWADPANPDRVLIITGEGGLLETRNGGESWRLVRWFGETLRRLIVNPIIPGEMFVLTDRGRVWKTADTGETWSDISGSIARPDQLQQPLPTLTIPPSDFFPSFGFGGGGATALMLDPILPRRLYAISREELLRSDSGGDAWTRVRIITGPSGGKVQSVAVNPSDATLFVVIGPRLFSSTDGGVRWSVSEFPRNVKPSWLLTNPLKPEVMFAIGE